MWVEIVSVVAFLFFKITVFTIFCMKNYHLIFIFTAIYLLSICTLTWQKILLNWALLYPLGHKMKKNISWKYRYISKDKNGPSEKLIHSLWVLTSQKLRTEWGALEVGRGLFFPMAQRPMAIRVLVFTRIAAAAVLPRTTDTQWRHK